MKVKLLSLLGLSFICLSFNNAETQRDNQNDSRDNRDRIQSGYQTQDRFQAERDSGYRAEVDQALPTPSDQPEAEGDRQLVQRIRQELIRDNRISLAGKNLYIMSVDGKVTLRGPVKSPEEKSVINEKVRQVQGVKNVVDQIQVNAVTEED